MQSTQVKINTGVEQRVWRSTVTEIKELGGTFDAGTKTWTIGHGGTILRMHSRHAAECNEQYPDREPQPTEPEAVILARLGSAATVVEPAAEPEPTVEAPAEPEPTVEQIAPAAAELVEIFAPAADIDPATTDPAEQEILATTRRAFDQRLTALARARATAVTGCVDPTPGQVNAAKRTLFTAFQAAKRIR